MTIEKAAKVLLDDMRGALDGSRRTADRWSRVADAMQAAPNAFGSPTPLQMLRAALEQLAGSVPGPDTTEEPK